MGIKMIITNFYLQPFVVNFLKLSFEDNDIVNLIFPIDYILWAVSFETISILIMYTEQNFLEQIPYTSPGCPDETDCNTIVPGCISLTKRIPIM